MSATISMSITDTLAADRDVADTVEHLLGERSLARVEPAGAELRHGGAVSHEIQSYVSSFREF